MLNNELVNFFNDHGNNDNMLPLGFPAPLK